LIVEDERSLLSIQKRGLEDAGYEVLGAASISEAPNAVAHRPDLILLDVGSSGWRWD
jgi:DNA-binding response OmpR family regulator